MTGMKEGAGEDPFADDDSVEDDQVDSKSSNADHQSKRDGSDQAMEGGSTEAAGSSSNRTMSIPYKFRRDSVQEGRDRVPLFLHPDTKTAEREAMRDLEDRFDDSVSMTDLREALVKVGLENLDETASTMEEWGYGLDFD